MQNQKTNAVPIIGQLQVAGIGACAITLNNCDIGQQNIANKEKYRRELLFIVVLRFLKGTSSLILLRRLYSIMRMMPESMKVNISKM